MKTEIKKPGSESLINANAFSKKNQTSTTRKVVALVGPTGSGKTSWAKILAAEFKGKIISADSRQIYRGMDIGTAKDKSFPQGLIDIIDPDKIFSVAEYQKLANELIEKYLQTKNLPMLVGGTGLYVEAVIYGFLLPELKEESLKLREKLEKLTDEELIERLKEIDKGAIKTIDLKNRRRVIRALEYSLLNEEPFSSQSMKRRPIYKSLIIGINVPRETLYAKIDARVELQIKKGLIEEVRNLLKRYPADTPALNSIGYKEIIDYINGKVELKEAIERIKFNSHAYVRRQDTWFRRNKDVKWVKTIEEAEKKIRRFLK